MATLLWVFAAVLTAGVVIPLAAVLMGPRPAAGASADGLAAAPTGAGAEVYRRQLADLRRDAAAGLIEPDRAAQEEAELARRLLAAVDEDDLPADRLALARPARPARRLGLVLTALVPAASLALYLALGSPGLPSLPIAERDPEARQALAEAQGAAETLARRLEDEGGTVEDWMDLGARYRALGRPDEAVAALARAVGLTDGTDPDVLSAYGEALVDQAAVTVTAEAIGTFEQVLAERPDDPRARFYLALGRAQAGDLVGALDRWQALMRDTPADAPWLPLLASHIRDTAVELGQDPEVALPPPAPPIGVPGPDADDVAAAQGLSGDQQQALIDGMVEGLAIRLEEQPEDIDGWLRLARAYRVLGREEDALAALASARAAAPDDLRVLEAESAARLEGLAEGGPSDEALAALDRLLQADPDNRLGLWQLGQLSEFVGDLPRAVAVYTRLLDGLPEDDPGRATVEARLQQVQAALDDHPDTAPTPPDP